MSAGEIIALAGVAIVGFGLAATWVKNGRIQDREFGALQENLKGVNDKLEDPNYGLGALNEKMSDFKITCAQSRTSFAEKIKKNESDIKDLKKK